MSKFIIYQHNCINDEEQCYLVATCWVNETIVFIISNSETSQILMWQILLKHLSTAITSWFPLIVAFLGLFSPILRDPKICRFYPKDRNFSQNYTEKTNLVQNFHFKKIQHVAKIHSQLLITANQIPNTQHVLRDHHNKPVSDVVAQNEGEQLQWGSNISKVQEIFWSDKED